MARRGNRFGLVIVAMAAIAVPLLAGVGRGQDMKPNDSSGTKPYLPPDNYTPTQLRAHIDKLKLTPVKDRKPEVAEGIIVAADRILAGNPNESQRTFAAISLMDGLHQSVEDGKKDEDDKRLAEVAGKYANDKDRPVAITAQFYVLEQRVLKPDEIPAADLPKVLDEVKADISDRVLTAKYHRIINNIEPLINRLPTDQEADQRFKDFSRILLKTRDTDLVKLGNKFRTAKRDPSAVQSKDTAAPGTTPRAASEPEPSEIFKEVAAAYNGMETYSDEGTIAADVDAGGVKQKIETAFSLKMKKPNSYLITWDQNMGFFKQSGAVWNDGTQPYFYMGATKSYSKMGSDEIALGAATGVSNGAATTVPSLFLAVYKNPPAPFAQLVDPKLQPSESIDGDDCYVISGSSATAKHETCWVSKKSHLIRKYSRSLEPPEGDLKVPNVTDAQLDEAIKGMGQEVTNERRDAMRKMMTSAKDMMKGMKIQGAFTELHTKITSPNLAPTDFSFTVPEGTTLKE